LALKDKSIETDFKKMLKDEKIQFVHKETNEPMYKEEIKEALEESKSESGKKETIKVKKNLTSAAGRGVVKMQSPPSESEHLDLGGVSTPPEMGSPTMTKSHLVSVFYVYLCRQSQNLRWITLRARSESI